MDGAWHGGKYLYTMHFVILLFAIIKSGDKTVKLLET